MDEAFTKYFSMVAHEFIRGNQKHTEKDNGFNRLLDIKK